MQPTRDFFFVLATPRSGSTWLEQTLDIHPDVTCLHEPSSTFHNPLMHRLTSLLSRAGHAIHCDDLADRALELLPFRYEHQLHRLDRRLVGATTSLSGAKLLLRQMIRYTDFVQFLIRYRHARFILLTRASPVDAICSLQVAQRTRVYHSATAQHNNIAPFAIDPEWASMRIRSQLLYQSLIVACLRDLNAKYMHVSYEHMMSNTEVILDRIARFLGIGHMHKRSPLRKLVVHPYRDIITNYDQLGALTANIEREMNVRSNHNTITAGNV